MSNTPRDWTVLSMLEWATDYFKQKGIPDPRLSIEWLLAEVLDLKRLDLYLKFDRPLSESELGVLRPLVKRRASHEPLQYIIGYTDFMNARIRVTPDVLIPRIETEQLVELILQRYPADTHSSLTALDLGTGSGCIPIALKMERPQWALHAIDISEEALKVARQNAEEQKAEIRFRHGDLLQPDSLDLEGPYDLIISNPPYVLPEEREHLEPQVVEHEPEAALFTDDPKQIYGSIIKIGEQYLTENGSLFLELHDRYAAKISELFEPNRWHTEIKEDYEGKPRFIHATRRP